MLNSTSVPLFFLFAQLLIAVILFLISHAFGLIKVPLYINWALCKGLAPMIILNVVGLRYVSTSQTFRLCLMQLFLYLVSVTSHSNTSMHHSTKWRGASSSHSRSSPPSSSYPPVPHCKSSPRALSSPSVSLSAYFSMVSPSQ